MRKFNTMELKKTYAALNFFRTILPCLCYIIDKKLRIIVNKDMDRQLYQCKYKNAHSIAFLNYLLINDKPFRSIFYYRIKRHRVVWLLSHLFLKDLRDIEIGGEIKGGLCVFHGQGTVIYVHKAGENLRVWQNVTIGRNPNTSKNGIDCPTIGDNVNIYTNSVVIGNITIGNNVNIGAGSVILKSVPDNCTVVGNPAVIVKENGKRIHKAL